MANSGNTSVLTLDKIAQSIVSGWELGDWFKWPPNMFALISMVLNRTGGYKICLTDDAFQGCWEESNWQENTEYDSDKWIEYSIKCILNKKETPLTNFSEFKITGKYYEKLDNYWKVINVDELRTIHRSSNDVLKDFAVTLIAILAIADNCGRALGSIGQDANADKKKLKLFHSTANLLLNNKGSLSTIPKFHGIVLPKMRTPQSGIVSRGLSLYLTFHITEVEVMWRTFPWLNNNKLSLNILAVPYPPVQPTEKFRHLEDRNHRTRYFQVLPDVREDQYPDIFFNGLVKKVFDYANSNHAIDVVVFPEMALSEEDYTRLLKLFYNQYNKNEFTRDKDRVLQLPILISGVLKEEKNGLPRIDNELRIATFFAGKWYHIIQKKHHRWQLDRNQIIQYGLENILTTDRNWYEYIPVCQRSLSILAPNGWLALTALICEDLARQEPVGEVIRGIGPTLLFALLSDGPQLTNRWSARYASVLADDPGTAVLSLTSKGMADLSQQYDLSVSQLPYARNENKSTVVGLWKDMIRGWKELCIKETSDAIAFTISAQLIEEFSLDRRTDHSNASVFRMDTNEVKPIIFDKLPSQSDRKIEENNLEGSWNDIRELSALLFSIDAIIDLLTNYANEKDRDEIDISLDMILSLFPRSEDIVLTGNDFYSEIVQQINDSWSFPERLGIEVDKKEIPEDFKVAIPEIETLLKRIKNPGIDKNNLIAYYTSIVDLCEEGIASILSSEKENARTKQMPYLGFLVIIDTKLSNWKSRKDLNPQSNIKWRNVVEIKDKIYAILKKRLPNI